MSKKQRERRKKKSDAHFLTRVNTSVVYTAQLAYYVF